MIMQMPKGVPIATVAINNATNANLLAVRMLGMIQDADHLLARLCFDAHCVIIQRTILGTNWMFLCFGVLDVLSHECDYALMVFWWYGVLASCVLWVVVMLVT
jgi:hypothetical protein